MKRTMVLAVVLGMVLALPQISVAGPGELDRSFGKGGIARVPGENRESRAFDVAVGSDGRIVTVGDSDPAPLLAGLVRGGSLDSAFGDGGLAPSVPWRCERCVEPLDKVLRQGTGFLAAGVHRGGGVVARVEANGEFSSSWGLDEGYTDVGGSVWDMAVTPGGKILAVAGDYLVRLDSDGRMDESFGEEGRVMIERRGRGRSRLSPLTVDAARSGAIVVAGTAYSRGESQKAFVMKLDKMGRPDKSFGPSRSGVFKPRAGYAWEVEASTDGIYVSATLLEDGGNRNDAAVFKVSYDGKPVSGFGKRGLVRSRSGRAFSADLIVTKRNLVVGTGIEPGDEAGLPSTRISLMTRKEGKLIRSFGHEGRLMIPRFQGRGMTVDDEGRILIAGSRGTRMREAAAVVRLMGK